MPTRLGVLLSGSGSTANYIAQEIQQGNLHDAEIACAVSSLSKAGGIAKMQSFGIPTSVIRLRDFPDDPFGFGQRILDLFEQHGVTDVMQLGWMPLTPPNVIERYEGHIYNQHPGPLPDFGGDKMAGQTVHDTVLRFRKKVLEETGRIIPATYVVSHRVTNELDGGPVVKFVPVPIIDEDTASSLAKLALPVEWQVQAFLVQDIAHNSVSEQSHPSIVLPHEREWLKHAKQEAVEAAAHAAH